MERNILKKAVSLLFLILLVMSCKKEYASKEDYEIDKAIELTKSNTVFNDTLSKFRKELGVDFMLCYIISKEKHRMLLFQILQSDMDKAGPLKIDKPFKIENLQGIDVFFCTANNDAKKHLPIIDHKTKKLIAKGYLSTTKAGGCYLSKSITLVYCKNDDDTFNILPSEFMSDKEMEADSNGKYFHEEDYYPKCN